MNRKQMQQELRTLVVWALIGWGVSELIIWLTPFTAGQVQTFFAGMFGCFLVLTAVGAWRIRTHERANQEAQQAFERDMKADQKKQREIDRKIIEKLRNEHTLSGDEQDRRLKAFEAALKHLRREG